MNLAVLFKSNKRSKGGAGAICTATCVSEAATTAAPITAAPTTAAPTTAGLYEAFPCVVLFYFLLFLCPFQSEK